MKHFWGSGYAKLPSTLLITAVALLGCGGSKQGQQQTPAAQFVKPIVHQVMNWSEYPGRLASPQTVTVSARVSGIIESAPFEEGSMVQKGDVLFVIDERPFRADYQAKLADLSAAKAQLAKAQAHFKRYEQLKGTKAISGEDYDQALAALEQAQATIEVAQSAVEISKLNLEWTRVLAPISGQVSKKDVTEGNLITGGAGMATPLTTITSVDPMFCYVNAPEQYLFTYKKLISDPNLPVKGQQLPCFSAIGQNGTFTFQGVIDFVDNQVNQDTGTVEVRCAIPNPNGALSSGLFARLKIPSSLPYQTVLIPDSAIGTDQSSRFVLLIDQENKIKHQAIEPGTLFGGMRSITGGLSADDRVVSTGMQQLRPGTVVTPEEQPLPPEALAALPDPKLLNEAMNNPAISSKAVESGSGA